MSGAPLAGSSRSRPKSEVRIAVGLRCGPRIHRAPGELFHILETMCRKICIQLSPAGALRRRLGSSKRVPLSSSPSRPRGRASWVAVGFVNHVVLDGMALHRARDLAKTVATQSDNWGEQDESSTSKLSTSSCASTR